MALCHCVYGRFAEEQVCVSYAYLLNCLDMLSFSAGKPLRIKLGTRLGLGTVSDNFPASKRHYEAQVPDTMASLAESIPCSQIPLNLHGIEYTVRTASGATEVAVRLRSDGSPEAFVSVAPDTSLTSGSLKEALTHFLPGYCIPDPLHLLSQPLTRTSDGNVDFLAMQKEMGRRNASTMSSQALIVRDIVADLLQIDGGIISADSDFFLLGGNSLLLGQLSHQIRKRTGASISVSAIFINSTIKGIGSLLEAEEPSSSRESLFDDNLYSAKTSVTMFDLPGVTRHRGQTHPIVLIVQLLPTVFFYPLKTALTCMFYLISQILYAHSPLGTLLLFVLSYLAPLLSNTFWARMLALLTAIFAARLTSRIVCPIAAIVFKWIVIGKYKPGKYRM